MSVASNGGPGAGHGADTGLHVIIGLKRLDAAKQRLAPDLTALERSALMLRMLSGVVTEARRAAIGTVTLATSEPTGPGIAAGLGIDAVSDAGLPWNEGLVHVLGQLPTQPRAVLYLAGDLPLLTAADIRTFLDQAPKCGVAIARARDGGTNALLIRPATAMHPLFGVPRSSVAHAHRATQHGLEQRTFDIAGLALDVDTMDDARDAGLLVAELDHVATRNQAGRRM